MSVAKSPDKPRDHFQLANAYFDLGTPEGCAQSAAEYEKTAQFKPDGYTRYNLLIDWGLALDCAGQPEPRWRASKRPRDWRKPRTCIRKSPRYMASRDAGPEALDALQTAEKLDPTFAPHMRTAASST